jgi:2-amino-4-hydroxy-6-hydroxymethyldihydropteridine diphosphokinase
MKMKEKFERVYVGMGGNIGDTFAVMQRAVTELAQMEGINEFECSEVYQTTPVTPYQDIPQEDYLNTVCRFTTSLEPLTLLQILQSLEEKLGKVAAPKNSARVIDLDILFFGCQEHNLSNLIIPHPKWKERLFVLRPLLDLTEKIQLPDATEIQIKHLITCLANSDDRVTLHNDKIKH